MRFAKGIKVRLWRVGFHHLHPSCLSFPGTAQPRTSLYLGSRSWLTINMLQTGCYAHPVTTVIPEKGFDFGWLAPRLYEPIYDEYTSRPTRPIVDGEAQFEDFGIDNDPAGIEVKGFWTGYDVRNAAYQSVFAGGAGQHLWQS